MFRWRSALLRPQSDIHTLRLTFPQILPVPSQESPAFQRDRSRHRRELFRPSAGTCDRCCFPRRTHSASCAPARRSQKQSHGSARSESASSHPPRRCCPAYSRRYEQAAQGNHSAALSRFQRGGRLPSRQPHRILRQCRGSVPSDNTP